MSGSTAYGKDIVVRLLRRVTSTNNIKIDATVVRANICQGGMYTAAESLKNQGIYLEVGLVKTSSSWAFPQPVPSMTSQRARPEMVSTTSWPPISNTFWFTAAFSS